MAARRPSVENAITVVQDSAQEFAQKFAGQAQEDFESLKKLVTVGGSKLGDLLSDLQVCVLFCLFHNLRIDMVDKTIDNCISVLNKDQSCKPVDPNEYHALWGMPIGARSNKHCPAIHPFLSICPHCKTGPDRES